jgi:hypothetical protein
MSSTLVRPGNSSTSAVSLGSPTITRAILTNSSIIKLGYHIQQVLQDIGTSYNDPEILRAAKSNASLIDLSQYAKLKGVISDATSVSLQCLVGSILKKYFTCAVRAAALRHGMSEFFPSVTSGSSSV